MLLIIGFFVWMQRRAAGQMGNVMSIGRSRAKAYTTDKPSTTFADIAGYEGVKQEITEVVDFLRMPDRFREIGARVPKGMLLVGPPGTGKTLFARAVAGEAGVGFLSVTGSDFMEMFVGVGASRVRDLFQQARRMGRAIIFIDEIDSIGRKRGAGLGGGHDEREQTLNQMLSEMDGFETSEGIVILAATNRPDILDPALLRPGRFDRSIVVPLPEFSERRAILDVHSRDKRIGADVDLDVMAAATPGMSGADLANLVNEAALVAVRRGAKEIERIDFENARDRVVLGARRESLVLSAEEKRATAYHEGGHALLATVLPHGDPLHKVTILPRGMALGVTWSLPQERHTYSKEFFEDTICKAMGGRVAEKIVFDHVNSGAANDLEQATSIARRMVREWGMSDRVGPMAWSSERQAVFLGEDLMTGGREYSDDTAKLLDEEVARILTDQEQRAIELLEQAPPRPRADRRGAAGARDDRWPRGRQPHPAGARRVRRHGEVPGQRARPGVRRRGGDRRPPPARNLTVRGSVSGAGARPHPSLTDRPGQPDADTHGVPSPTCRTTRSAPLPSLQPLSIERVTRRRGRPRLRPPPDRRGHPCGVDHRADPRRAPDGRLADHVAAASDAHHPRRQRPRRRLPPRRRSPPPARWLRPHGDGHRRGQRDTIVPSHVSGCGVPSRHASRGLRHHDGGRHRVYDHRPHPRRLGLGDA